MERSTLYSGIIPWLRFWTISKEENELSANIFFPKLHVCFGCHANGLLNLLWFQCFDELLPESVGLCEYFLPRVSLVEALSLLSQQQKEKLRFDDKLFLRPVNQISKYVFHCIYMYFFGFSLSLTFFLFILLLLLFCSVWFYFIFI